MRQWAPCGHPASTSVTSGPPPPAVLQSQFLLAFISVHAKLHVTCFLPGAWHEQRMIPGPWASSSLHSGSACATHGSGRASEGRCWAPLPERLGLGCYSHHLRLLSLCSRSDTGPGLQAELEGVVVLAAREQTSPYTSAMAIAPGRRVGAGLRAHCNLGSSHTQMRSPAPPPPAGSLPGPPGTSLLT